MSATHPSTGSASAAPMLLLARAAGVLSVLALLGLGVSGGGLVTGDGAVEGIHGALAIGLHVVSGLVLVALVVLRATRTAAVPVAALVLAAVVFGYGFAQAWFGSHGPIAVHVPGAIALTVAATWLTAWLFRAPGHVR